MVTDTLSTNQVLNRARRVKPKGGDPTHVMLAAQRLGMSEDFLTEAAKALRVAMVDRMTAHPPRPSRRDGSVGGMSARLSAQGQLLAALGFEPEGLSDEERLYGLTSTAHYERERVAFAEAG